MLDVTWIAEIVFFGSYFIAWVSKEIPHTTWLTVSAIAALVIALMLLFFRGYPYVNRRTPEA